MSQPYIETLISEEALSRRVAELGCEISRDYRDKNLLGLCVLKGSFIFSADLARRISVPARFEFMRISSYCGGTDPGELRLSKDADIPAGEWDILLIEDIIDSGRTAEFAAKLVESSGPRSLKICALLDKPSKRVAKLRADYLGFEIPDVFVVGYGMDYGEQYRGLPYIGALNRNGQ